MTDKSPRTAMGRLTAVLLAVTCGPPVALLAIGLVVFSDMPVVQWIAGGFVLSSLVALIGMHVRQRTPRRIKTAEAPVW